MPKKTRTATPPPPPPPPNPVAQWVEMQKTASLSSEEDIDNEIPDWDLIQEKLEEVGLDIGVVLAARWKRSMELDFPPTEGSILAIEFMDDTYRYEGGGLHDPFPPHGRNAPPPPPPPPTTPPLGFSPITSIQTEPVPPPPQTMGLSPITCTYTSPTETTQGHTTPVPATPTVKTEIKKRKGKTAREKPYAIKRRLDEAEAKKIATAPPVADNSTRDTVPPSAKTPSPKPKAPTPEPPKTSEAPKTLETKKTTPPKKTIKLTGKNANLPIPPSSPDATTSKYGVVVHGIALRKDLGKVRRWLEDGNPDLGKTVGIRWLRKKSMLLEEGKKTSSIVVYLEGEASVEKVRLGGKWLRVNTYEANRRRK